VFPPKIVLLVESVAEAILKREAFFWVADIRYRQIGILPARNRTLEKQ